MFVHGHFPWHKVNIVSLPFTILTAPLGQTNKKKQNLIINYKKDSRVQHCKNKQKTLKTLFKIFNQVKTIKTLKYLCVVTAYLTLSRHKPSTGLAPLNSCNPLIKIDNENYTL